MTHKGIICPGNMTCKLRPSPHAAYHGHGFANKAEWCPISPMLQGLLDMTKILESPEAAACHFKDEELLENGNAVFDENGCFPDGRMFYPTG